MKVYTRNQVKQIAAALKQRVIEFGELTNVDNRFIFHAVFGTNGYYADRTNALGGISDIWNTPYRFEILVRTNFIIRSAGPNKIFGDADDIIFDSLSNDFVKP